MKTGYTKKNRTPIFFIVQLFLICVMYFAHPDCSLADSRARYLKYEGQKYYWGKGVPKSYEKALQLYLQAAKLGDNEAQYIAGGMYFRGMGAPRNLSKAFELLHDAALQGKSTPESQKLLGEFFLKGLSIPQNFEKAMDWYEKAARNGDRDAQSELGYFYFTGKGVRQDFDKAFNWFEKSARQGLPSAQYSLAIMWYSGTGVPQSDIMQSYAWLSVAAANNHPDAPYVRDYLTQGFSREELKQAQSLATTLFDEISKRRK